MPLGELAPLAPEGAGVLLCLAALMTLCACLVALGLIKLADAFVRALFSFAGSAVGWIPLFGKVAKWPIEKIQQKLINTLGAAERKLDGAIAWSWHNLAKLVRWTAREFKGLGLELWHLRRWVALLSPAWIIYKGVRALLHPIRTAQHVEAALLRAERAALARLRHTVVAGVWPRIGRIEHELDRVIEHDIPSLRARTRTLEREALREFRWLRSRPWLIVSAAFVGAVEIALRRLGLGWLRCRNVRRTGRFLCGLPANLLEDLLGLALGFELLIDPEEIARLALDLEDAFVDVFETIAG